MPHRRRRRRYRSTSKSYRALLRYIARFQADNKIAPKGLRECGRVIGISHSQVRRLLDKAEAGGILKKTGPQPLAYAVIHNPPTDQGVVWVPIAECSWGRRIDWTANPARGVSLDRAAYGIDDENGLRALSFSSKSPTGEGAKLGFNEHALALVRPCAKDKALTRKWYIIETGGRVRVAGCIHKGRRRSRNAKREVTLIDELTFISGVKREGAWRVDVRDIEHLAEVIMITRKPPPAPPPLRKRSGGGAAVQ